MTQTLWTAVDAYFVDALITPDPALDAALANSEANGLPPIYVAPNQGKLLMLLAQINGTRRILEIGTLGGYSTLWLAQALPASGKLISLEYDAKYAEVARANIAHAGLAEQVEVRVGAALDTLPSLVNEAPFDLIFIDADKKNNPSYFEWALRLARSGSVIIVDNVVRDGKVIDGGSSDESVLGTRRLFEVVGNDARVAATALQTVGSKGYDGLLLAVVK
jgi:predicted O-methyltransferase YrrM